MVSSPLSTIPDVFMMPSLVFHTRPLPPPHPISRTQQKGPCLNSRSLESYITSRKLLLDLGNNAGTNSVAAFADSETHAFFHGNRGDQLNVHINVVAGHAHLSAFGQGDDAGNVGGTEVELRTIVVEEGGVTAALVLGQDVDLADELGVGMDGTCLLYTSDAADE